MTKKTVMVLSTLIVLVLLGFSAYTFNTKSLAMGTRNWNNNDRTDNYSYGMMSGYNNETTDNYSYRMMDGYNNETTDNYGYGMMGGYNNDRSDNYGYGMMGGYNNDRTDNYGYGMMGSYSNNGVCGSRNSNFQSEDYDVNKILPMETLEENVKKYISYYDNKLEIEDIFIYSDSEYYFSIVEEATGKGAMELLVDPITGYVFPEFGPNMMWNTKYGMHGNNGYGMMGMMGGYSFNTNFENDKRIDEKKALEEANNYLARNSDSNLTVEGGGHEFYGYYTFHVIGENETVGMLSVNYYTGELWYHDWHGNLTEVISAHHEKK